MATYTITVNERTREGKGLVNYLKTLGVIEVPNEKTRKAIQEIREGKGTVCARLSFPASTRKILNWRDGEIFRKKNLMRLY